MAGRISGKGFEFRVEKSRTNGRDSDNDVRDDRDEKSGKKNDRGKVYTFIAKARRFIMKCRLVNEAREG